jgi:prepilin-type N-terminal cleavage/methylation domain-containing protein/prepilin-type processing-associated H-X9-DG protein
MKPQCSNQRDAAMTLVEVLVVIVVLAILVAILLPALVPYHDGRQRINCASNLKQIGLAYRIWEGDHDDKYPMQVSVTNGGAAELIATGNVAACFQVMSNELSTAIILLCPEDKTHIGIRSFAGLSNSNISYFVGLDVTNEMNPQMLLCGDDNFLLNGSPIKSGLCAITSDTSFAWDDTRHFDVRKNGWFSRTKIGYGNLLMADGSVQIIYQDGLHQAFQQSGFTNRLAIP